MEMNIYNSDGIVQMNRNQKLSPGNIFLIGSESVTNSLYFRYSSDIQYAHKVINQKLSGILYVLDYLFTPNGWLLLVKIKSKTEIISYYKRLKASKGGTSQDVDPKSIISEVIRLAISSIAANVNRSSKRKGVLVNRAFKRFEISSISMVQKLMRKMKRREIILSNQRKQFQPSTNKWQAKILSNIGLCFLSSEKSDAEEDEFMDSSIKTMDFIEATIIKGLTYKDNLNRNILRINV